MPMHPGANRVNAYALASLAARGDPRALAAIDAATNGAASADAGIDPSLGLPPQDLINSLYDIFGDYPRKNVLPYFYRFQLTVAEGTALAANGTQRATIKVSADASFVCTQFMGTSDGEYLLFLRTDSSDRQLMDDPVHSASIVGTAERPYNLVKPLLMAPNTTLSFTLNDLSANVNEVYFTMGGFKVYRRQYAMAG